MAMTAVACNKCGEPLHIDKGSPSGLKVVKCPACNYPNLFTLPLKNQEQPASPSQGDAPRSGASNSVELGPPGSSLDLPKPGATPGPKAAPGRIPAVGRAPAVDLPTPAKTPRASTSRPSDPQLPAPVGALGQNQPSRPGQARQGSSADLPAPVRGRTRRPTDVDLPAPRRAPTGAIPPSGLQPDAEAIDLPVPRQGSGSTPPGMLRPATRSQTNLPVPSRPASVGDGPEIIDLPAPLEADEDDGLDLLAPAGPGVSDLPRPVSGRGGLAGAGQPTSSPDLQVGGSLDDDPFGMGGALGDDNPLEDPLGDGNPLDDPFGGSDPLGASLDAGGSPDESLDGSFGGGPSLDGGNPLGDGDPFGGNPLGESDSFGGNPLGDGDPFGGNPLGDGDLLGGDDPFGGNPLGDGNPLDDVRPVGAPLGDGDPLGASFDAPSAHGAGAGAMSSDFFGDMDAPGNLLDQGGQGGDSDFFGGLGGGQDGPPQVASPAKRAPRASSQAGSRAGGALGLDMPGDGPGLSLADPDDAQGAKGPSSSSLDLNALDLGGGDDGGNGEPLALNLAERSEPVSMGATGVAGAAQKAGKPASAMDVRGDSMDIGLPDLPGSAPASAQADDEGFGGLDLPSIPGPSPRAKDKNKEAAEKSKGTEQKRDSLASRAKRLATAEEGETPELALEDTAVPQITHGIVASHHTRRHEAIRRARRRKRILTAVAVVLLAGAGAGGFVTYTRWQESQKRQATIAGAMQQAEIHLRAEDPGHWERAGDAAQRVLTVDPMHAEALGIAAEAAYAALLDEGTRADERRAKGTEITEQIDKNVAKGLHVDKAQALKSIAQARPEPAIERLQRVLERKPNDPDALLYLGWAHAAANDLGRAVEAFTNALDQSTERKLPAMYGLAQAQLAMNDHAAAREIFDKILSLRADHVGALVGKAQVAEVAQPGDREGLYLDILKRDDLDRADPRAVSRAWELAGYQALGAGRIEEAKRRFGQAVEKSPGNIQALIGQAKVALLQKRFEDARTALTTVLRAAPDHIEATLTFADLSLYTDKLDEAREYADKIIARQDRLEDKSNVVRAYLLRGKSLEADESKLDEAITAYERARELAGEDAIQPAVALAKVLTRTERAEEARAVLHPVQDKASTDAVAANTLGIIYAEAGALNEAEEWFRKTLELRADDMDAQLQLGKVLIAQKRHEEAIATLQTAFQADPSRVDIGVTLADQLEQRGQLAQAEATFAALLEAGTPGVSVLARAGLFYARIGKAERAGELGGQILSQQENHAAGLFLRGEGHYYKGEYREALHSYRDAVSISSEPLYLEAQGRASEKLNLYKEAMDAYTKAAEGDSTYLAPRLGQANLLIQHREFQKALELLANARKLDAKDPLVHFYLGVCYQAQGDDKRAAESLRTSLRYDSRHAEAHYRIGRSYFELSELSDAAAALDRATDLAKGDEPWLPRAYLDLGYVQRSRSKRREAIRAWQKYLTHVPEDQDNSAETKEVKRLLMGLREQSR